MATISAANNEKVYSIQKWLGLNEHPDGDTRLKLGEASEMVNFRITKDGNLKRRPGTECIFGFCSDYEISISPHILFLTTLAEDDEVELFYYASAKAVPGVVTLAGLGGIVEPGTYVNPEATVDDGIMGLPDDAVTIMEGVMRTSGGEPVTIEVLRAKLDALPSGEYLYVYYDELPYAVNADCLVQTEDGYRFSGFPVMSEPVVESSQPITGMWTGLAGNKEWFLVACDGKIWNMYESPGDVRMNRQFIAELDTSTNVTFFPFDNKVYILNGKEYYVFDGIEMKPVVGYDPLVCIAIGPLDTASMPDGPLDTASNAGDLTGEYVNLLCPKRHAWISPDGSEEHLTFQLPEKNLKSIDYVKNLATGETVTSGWTANAENGIVMFSATLPKAVNSYEIGYTAKTHSDDNTIPDYRVQVASNLYAELYSGTTDTRVFIYGNGTNKALYSGMDYDGMPRADYFPDQYEVAVGDSNTPITQMIRHYGDLVTYKPGEAWNLQHGIVELATADLTPAVYAVPVNRDIGNEAPGMVRLVDNNPITAFGGNLFQWINSSWGSSNLTRDERQAKRISDNVQKTLEGMDLTKALMWDDNDNHEFYVVQGGTAVVLNYTVNAWYVYDNFDAVRMCNYHGMLYLGTSTGKVLRLTEDSMGDEGHIIHAKWKSGATDFGAGHMRKFSSMLWVGLKPMTGTSVDITLLTDRKDTFREKVASSTKAKVAGEPFMTRIKLKAKKFVFYHLIFEVDTKQPPVTITNVDFRVRITGYAK